MTTLTPILIFSLLLAYLTERTTNDQSKKMRHQTGINNALFVLLVLVLAMPIGLRTFYNDTLAYIDGFINHDNLSTLLAEKKLHILRNPAFTVYTALIRRLTDNYHIYFLIPAIFVQYTFVSSIRRYSPSFTLGIGLYICLGTYVFSFAAMKQTISMAIIMLAMPMLFEKKYVQYYLMVFAAFLFHTYAIALAVLPLFMVKPWSARTYIFLFFVLVIMNNFETVIGSFLDYANEQGKVLAEYEVFDNKQINLFRVAVYAIVPLLSLVFRRHLVQEQHEEYYNILIHMSIISFAFMLLGTINGANMFARMATYFEFGIILTLPWIIKKTFEYNSAKFVTAVASLCFLGFFVYGNMIARNFDDGYRAITIIDFLESLTVT